MSWTSNTESRCNNESCKATIFWNELVTHPVTKRPRPLDQPYHPDAAQAPKLHLCMKEYKPKQYIKKYFNDPILDGINYNRDLYEYLVTVGVAK